MSDRVKSWQNKYGDPLHMRDYLVYKRFLVEEIGLIDGTELYEWVETTGKSARLFIEDFVSRNEHKSWGAELKRDLTEWGYFA